MILILFCCLKSISFLFFDNLNGASRGGHLIPGLKENSQYH